MQERFVHFMFFEEIASRYRSLNSVFSVIEFCFSSDYPSMWFEVRRFNCCPTFVQIISNGTERIFSFSINPDHQTVIVSKLWLREGCSDVLFFSETILGKVTDCHCPSTTTILSKCIYTLLTRVGGQDCIITSLTRFYVKLKWTWNDC